MAEAKNGDRKFLALVAVITLLLGGGGATAARALWPQYHTLEPIATRVAVLEERFANIQTGMESMNAKIDRLIERER